MSSSRSTRRQTCCQEGTLRLSLAATARVRFARRERANGGSSTGGLPRRSGAPPCHLRNVSGATGPKSCGTSYFAPANAVSVCLTMDTRMISVEVHEPQLRLVTRMCARFAGSVFGSADVTRLPFSTGARRSQQRRSRLPPMRHIGSDYLVAEARAWWPSSPRHATSWRRSVLLGLVVLGEMGVQSHSRGVLGVAVRRRVDQFAARGSRTSPAHDAWLRTHQDVRSRDCFSCAHDQRVQEKQNKLVQTLGLNHGTTDIHSTEEDTKMEHSESINTESRSSRRTLTRVPKVTTESYPL